jgi:hypothetical protein
VQRGKARICGALGSIAQMPEFAPNTALSDVSGEVRSLRSPCEQSLPERVT